MANTTPDNIYFPTRDDMVAPLETVFATAASSIQAALNTRAIRNYRWDGLAQKDAQTGMRKGDEGKVISDMSRWVYDGTKWVSATTLTVHAHNPSSGTAYNGTAPVIFKAINVIVTTDGSGRARFPWPGGSFPNALLAYSPVIGDGNAYDGWVSNFGSNASEGHVIARRPNGPAVGMPLRFGGVALGW